MTYIVAGGILGLTLGAVIGGNLGYKIGTYAAWALLTRKMQPSPPTQPSAT